MDTLTTIGFSEQQIDAHIAATESAHPSRKSENDRWRQLLAENPAILKDHPEIDVRAAYLSTCRSDPLYCGACRLRTLLAAAAVDVIA